MNNHPRPVSAKIEENDRVVITEWRLPPRAETGWHFHSMDYVVVYRTAAKHIVETRDGIKAVDVVEGQSYFSRRGIEHNVINAGASEVILVETELK